MESTKIDKVPEPTLRRLPWYLSVCRLLKARGETFVSSTRLSKETNIVASQIAKDLSFVDVVGRTRVGYEIDNLLEVLETFLGFNSMHKAFIFGAGRLGSALLNDSGLRQFGLEIVAASPQCEDRNPDGAHPQCPGGCRQNGSVGHKGHLELYPVAHTRPRRHCGAEYIFVCPSFADVQSFGWRRCGRND